MGFSDWNWRHPVELQDVPWDCAAASLAWCLQAAGLPYTEADVVEGLGPSRISPTYGLLDASGAGLVEYLSEIGVSAENNGNASWADITSAAGYQPMLMGGRWWYHWTGVRVCPHSIIERFPDVLGLANPSPGWLGIYQTMYAVDFQQLGPFSAVWFTSW